LEPLTGLNGVAACSLSLAYANSAVKMIGIIALTIVCAYGSYVLIEAPARRRIREILARHNLKSAAA
jgi:peptidoglycan/LPS O-acetylase OafA/YrhL